MAWFLFFLLLNWQLLNYILLKDIFIAYRTKILNTQYLKINKAKAIKTEQEWNDKDIIKLWYNWMMIIHKSHIKSSSSPSPWRTICTIVWVHLVRMIVQVRPGACTWIGACVALVAGIVRVALVWMVSGIFAHLFCITIIYSFNSFFLNHYIGDTSQNTMKKSN